jgi:uncharacterized protein YkwD
MRSDAGAELLERRAALDQLASARARELAALPAAHRQLARPQSIGAFFAQQGFREFRRAAEHLDLKKGYSDLPAAFANTWVNTPESRVLVLDPKMDAVGIAMVQAEDGWVILEAVIIEDRSIPADVGALERLAIIQVNRIRTDNDLRALREHAELSAVARSHSEDMARRGYFAHISPGGRGPADRVRSKGISYTRVAENIQVNNSDDPVTTAVEEWVNSPGHRRNILMSGITHTGMGVAADETGSVYFTQLFLEMGFATDSGAGHRPR